MIYIKTRPWHHSARSIIWIFTEGKSDGIESRLPFKIFFTLHLAILCPWHLIWRFNDVEIWMYISSLVSAAFRCSMVFCQWHWSGSVDADGLSAPGSVFTWKSKKINLNFIKICCKSIDKWLKWKLWTKWLSMLSNDCNKNRQGVEIWSVYKWLSMTKHYWHKLGQVIESKAVVKELIVVIFE